MLNASDIMTTDVITVKKETNLKDLAGLLESREDFANMRLALRRKLTEKALGTDYSNEGSVSAEDFEHIFPSIPLQ